MWCVIRLTANDGKLQYEPWNRETLSERISRFTEVFIFFFSSMRQEGTVCVILEEEILTEFIMQSLSRYGYLCGKIYLRNLVYFLCKMRTNAFGIQKSIILSLSAMQTKLMLSQFTVLPFK